MSEIQFKKMKEYQQYTDLSNYNIASLELWCIANVMNCTKWF
jgi:hypothetical protein